jgi:catechol 2,3-dioxygenase
MTDVIEPIFDVAQLAHVELLTPDPAGTEEFFTKFLGLQVTERAGQSAYLRAYEEWYHHSLKITESPAAGVGHIAWRTLSPQALDRRVAALEASGAGQGWSDGDVGHGAAYRFTVPSGQTMEVLYDVDYHEVPEGERSPLLNRPQRRPAYGVPVRRLDHVTITAPDVGATRAFMSEQLGFRNREQIVTDDGAVELGAWMSISPLVHELAVVGDQAQLTNRLHHVCYWYGIPQHCADAAEVLREHGYEIECGPGKHGLAQGLYVYAFEPGGNRVELYGDSGYLIQDPAWKTITWRESQLDWGKSVYGEVPNSFFEIATPPVALVGGPAAVAAAVDRVAE